MGDRVKPSQAIAALNDAFRKTLVGGKIYMTAGVQTLGAAIVAEALSAVRDFYDFTNDNDPYGEHDFGSTEVQGHKVFWKIELYEERSVKPFLFG